VASFDDAELTMFLALRPVIEDPMKWAYGRRLRSGSNRIHA
jgi:hypothetical protein